MQIFHPTMKRRPVMKLVFLLAALALTGCAAVAAVLIAKPYTARAQTKSLQWTRLDCDITVQPNGDMRVVETNVIDFTDGTFTFGYRDFDTSRLDNITDITVKEDGQPLQYQFGPLDGSTFRLRYSFTPASHEQRTFTLAYTVVGATRYYTTGDEVYWAGVYAARNGFAVQASTVTVTLPAGATATQAATFGPRARLTGKGSGQVVASALAPVASGEQFEIVVGFPHGVISGAPPDWQADYDAQQLSQQGKQGTDALILLASLLVLFGGPALVVTLWATRGRDPQVSLVADYLNAPPEGITPGVAGTLVDERVDLQDIVATLIDLARRGVVVMQEQATTNPAGVVISRTYILDRGPAYETVQRTAYEDRLLNALELDRHPGRRTSDLTGVLQSRLGGVKDALYRELEKQGLYAHNPEQVRNRYTLWGVLMLVVSIVAACPLAVLLSDRTDMAICLPSAFGVTAVALLITANAMPARTRKGADAKVRCEAFKRYLANIEKYTDVQTATDLFDRYLPFAIAFGLDRTWVRKFSAVNAPAPAWFVPYSATAIPETSSSSAVAPSPTVPTIAMPSAGLPSMPAGMDGIAQAPLTLNALNQGLAGGLSSMNEGLTHMFTAVSQSFVAPSGGGKSTTVDGLKVAGAILGVALDIASAGGGGSSGGGGGGFG